MNKSYKSVWNESTGTWVAASELTTGRSKSKRAKNAISKAILAQIAVGGMSLAGAGLAMADDTVKSGTRAAVNIADGVAIGVDSEVDADPADATKLGGVAIGDSAYAVSSGVAIGTESQAGSDSLAFGAGAMAANGGTAIGANSYSINNGGVALGQSASVTGNGSVAIGLNSQATSSGSVALGQESVANRINTVSVGNATQQRQIVNVAAGTQATDAVNVGQLTAAGLSINTSGGVTNAFVAYDSTAKTSVTLGGGTAGTAIHNVAAGTTTTDAVNVGQLAAMGATIGTSGQLTNSFVAYDSTAKNAITLGGTAGTVIHNVAAGTTGTDAVNVNQLAAMGATIGTSGQVTNSFVAYDSAAKTAVTLGGGTAGTVLHNVAAGTTTTDAVNFGQLAALGATIGTSGQVTNAFVAYDSAAKSSVTLGGGTAGTAIHNVAAGTTTNDAVNFGQMTQAIAAAGTSGSGSPLAVSYDSAAKNSVTLGAGSAGAQIHNVAAGTTGTDAVNLAQLNAVSSTTSTIVDSLKYVKFGSSTAMTANATGSDSIAVGGNAFATGTGALAIGLNARATALNSVAIGVGSSTNSANTVSVGNAALQRRIVNVADGVADTDAATVGQLDSIQTSLNAALKAQQTQQVQQTQQTPVQGTRLLGASSPALLGAAQAFALTDVISVGQTDKLGQSEALGVDAMAIGLNSHANNVGAVSIGTGVSAGGVNSFALGVNSLTSGTNSSAMGVNAQAIADGALALGYTASAENTNAIAIGSNALASGPNSGDANTIAIGNGATSTGNGSMAIGSGSIASGTNTVLLGNNIVGTKAGKPAIGNNSVVLGNASDGSQDNVVSVGGTAAGTQRKIVNVAAGTTTTDAVNFGQMTAAIAAGAGTSNAVAYDTTAKDKVTLGGTSASKAVTLSNVAAGVAGTDAVNVNQLAAMGATIGSSGQVTNAFVAYDSTAKNSVTLGGGTAGTTIHNVAAGATTTDAVNVGQLAAMGATIGTSGQVTNAFVAYDSTAKNSVTLGGGTAGTTIHNVAAGATTTDAVNVGQLAAMGATIGTSGQVTNAFVAYDSTAKNSVTLGGGTAGTTIHNVAAGTTTTDAVNVGQLAAMGATIGSSGQLTNSFVAYDSTAKDAVTLGGGTAGTTIHNVAAGTTTTDAVNVGQLAAMGATIGTSGQLTNSFVAYDSTAKDVITLAGASGTKITKLVAGAVSSTSTDAINGSQLYNTAASTAAALGGGSTVDSTGKVTAPTMSVGGTNYTNVAAAVDAAAALASTGSVNGVVYDTTAHDKVTFGGTGASKAVTLSNVAAGVAGTDAVNVDQLAAMGATIGSSGQLTNSFVAYDSTAKDAVTLGGSKGTVIHNVAAGTTSTDAVNLAQLTAMGATIGSSGQVTNSFVAYDSTAKDAVTLGGSKGTVIHNVAAGTTSTDAVNLAQLTAMGATIGSSGQVTNSFVAYDSTAKDAVTLGGGTAGTTIHNVAAGTTTTDAVNVGQLAAMGATIGTSGQVTNSFVAYDSAAKNSVTLGGGATGTQIHNVAAGTAATDAVNVAQLAAVTSTTTTLSDALKYVRFGASTAMTASASGTDSMAIGGNAFANANGALAIGLNARATALNSVAIGVGSSTNVANTVSVGSGSLQRRIINVADGVADSDAATVGQLDSIQANVSAMQKTLQTQQTPVQATRLLGASSPALLGASQTFALNDVVSLGTTDKLGRNQAQGTDAMAVGLNASAINDGAVAIGAGVSAGGVNSFALGVNSLTSGTNSSAMGVNAQAINDGALALGYTAAAENTDAIAIGTNALASGVGAVDGIAIGHGATTTGNGSMVIGSNSIASGTNTVLLGNNIVGTKAGKPAIGNNSVVLGNASDGSQDNVVSVGGTAAGTQRKIVNVAAGTTTTDAVNLGQMTAAIAAAGTGGSGGGLVTQAAAGSDILVASATDGAHVNFAGTGNVARELIGVADGTTAHSAASVGQLTQVATALGGGAGIDSKGQLIKPSYNVQGKVSNNVGDALTSLDTGINSLKTEIGSMTPGDGLVAQVGDSTGNITVGANTGGLVVDVTNQAGQQRKITGVANGDVSAASFDAINGSQLAGVSSSFATAIGGGSMMNADGSITLPSFNVGGTTMHNVGDALSNLDGRVTTNTTNLTNLQSQVDGLAAGGTAGGAATPNAVAYDTAAHDRLTLGSTSGGTTKLSGLTDGSLAAGSTDAVTGNQLFATNNQVASLTSAVQNISTTGSSSIGINGTNGADGAPGAPGIASATGSDAIAMGDKAKASGDHTIVIGGGASGTSDGAIAIGGNAGVSGKDSIAIGNGASAPADNAVALGANSVADRDNSVSVGSQGAERQITNVAAGTQGTDAVNLNQLNSATSGIARKAYSGIAAATALTMIPDVDANKTLSIGIGGGTFQGYAATAIGGTARITQNLKVRVGAGWSAAGTTVGAGASYQW